MIPNLLSCGSIGCFYAFLQSGVTTVPVFCISWRKSPCSAGGANSRRWMDSTIIKLLNEALRQSPSTGNGFGFGTAILLGVGLLCLGGLVVVYRDSRRYRDKQDAKRDREWKEQENKREEARDKLFNYFTAEFAESRKFFGNELDEIEKSFAPDREKIQAHDTRISRLEWELQSLKQKKGE